MSYRYQELRAQLFTDDGQRLLLKVRDRVHALLEESGACDTEHAIAGIGGDSWLLLACLDRLSELGELECIFAPSPAQRHVWRRTR